MNRQKRTWEGSQEAGVAGGLAQKTLVRGEVRGDGPGRSAEAVRLGFSSEYCGRPWGWGLVERMTCSDFSLCHIGCVERIHQKVDEHGRGWAN